MPSDPYRVAQSSSDDEAVSDPALFEERCVAAVLGLAGTIGVAVGFTAPHAHGVELVLGALFVVLALSTFDPRLAPMPDRIRHCR